MHERYPHFGDGGDESSILLLAAHDECTFRWPSMGSRERRKCTRGVHILDLEGTNPRYCCARPMMGAASGDPVWGAV